MYGRRGHAIGKRKERKAVGGKKGVGGGRERWVEKRTRREGKEERVKKIKGEGGSQRLKGEKWVGRSKGRVWRGEKKEVG